MFRPENLCFPFRVDFKEGVGRCMVATRDIQPLGLASERNIHFDFLWENKCLFPELILYDRSVALGPKAGCAPVCLQCLKPIAREEEVEEEGAAAAAAGGPVNSEEEGVVVLPMEEEEDETERKKRKTGKKDKVRMEWNCSTRNKNKSSSSKSNNRSSSSNSSRNTVVVSRREKNIPSFSPPCRIIVPPLRSFAPVAVGPFAARSALAVGHTPRRSAPSWPRAPGERSRSERTECGARTLTTGASPR